MKNNIVAAMVRDDKKILRVQKAAVKPDITIFSPAGAVLGTIMVFSLTSLHTSKISWELALFCNVWAVTKAVARRMRVLPPGMHVLVYSKERGCPQEQRVFLLL